VPVSSEEYRALAKLYNKFQLKNVNFLYYSALSLNFLNFHFAFLVLQIKHHFQVIHFGYHCRIDKNVELGKSKAWFSPATQEKRKHKRKHKD